MPQPPYRPTTAGRRAVMDLASIGTPVSHIARALRISGPTLRKHYGPELASAQAVRRAEVLLALWKSAMAGKVSAMVALLKIFARADAAERLLKGRTHDERS